MWGSFARIMTMLAMLYLFGALLRRRLEPCMLHMRGLFCALAMTGGLGYIILFLSPMSGTMSSLLTHVGELVIAVGYVSLTFMWMDLLARGHNRFVFEILLLSYLVSIVLSFISYAPKWACCAFMAISPIISTFALRAVASPNGCGLGGARNAGTVFLDWSGERAVDYGLRSLFCLPIGMVVLFGAFLFAGSCVVGILAFSTASVGVISRIITTAATIVLFAVAASLGRRFGHRALFVQASWVVVVLVYMVAMIVIVADRNGDGGIAGNVVEACLGCFELFLLYVLIVGTNRHGLSVMLVFGIAFALFKVAPSYFGKYLVPTLVGSASMGDAVFYPFVATTTALLFVVSFLFLESVALTAAQRPEIDDDMDQGEQPSDLRGQQVAEVGRGGFDDAVDAVSKRYLLTPRERDVMELIAQGFSYRAMADQLQLSLGTIQWYARAVYRKLDVHSKQEVIDLLRHE